eukprot:5613920-Prymnesium_polylepis.1
MSTHAAGGFRRPVGLSTELINQNLTTPNAIFAFVQGGVQVVCPDELVVQLQAGPGRAPGVAGDIHCGTSKLRAGYPERRGIQWAR